MKRDRLYIYGRIRHRMRIAGCMTKATNMHSEYLILIKYFNTCPVIPLRPLFDCQLLATQCVGFEPLHVLSTCCELHQEVIPYNDIARCVT
jgi:hypothetical protein